MKIVAYSKVPAATPFVHLGYLAATTTKPIQGLFWGGVVILIACFSIIGRQLSRRRESAESVGASRLHMHRLRVVRLAVLVLGVIVIVSAYVFGEKVYVAPVGLTRMQVVICAQYIKSSESGNDMAIVATLPTEEGEYNLRSVLSVGKWSVKEYADAWNTPLVLRATQHEGQLTYMIVSAGPDRVVGTRDDITSGGPAG
ncbi:MAG: hypothetical protein ABFE13_20320 [Phycisphaerales bacterium]